ncbi:protein ABHD15-like, partial [Littorina saxatilis]
TLLRRRDSLARLTCRDSALSHYVTLHCHAFRRALQLPVWCRNRHVQSLMALWVSEPGVQFDRKYLQLSDKGILALDWEVGGEHLPHGRHILLVLPDLPQSALQVSALCREAFNYGVRAVVVNRRGQGGSQVNTARLPGYGETGDLREVVDFLREEGVSLSAVGIGTGGDLLLSYLGEFGSSAYLNSAVCISPSYSAESTLHHLPFPYSCLYLSHLKQTVLTHAKVFGKAAQLARSAWTVQEFDRRLHCEEEEKEVEGKGESHHEDTHSNNTHHTHAHHHDHRHHHHQHNHHNNHHHHNQQHSSLEEFWAENEPLREADEISVPVLCVSSLDDPICSSKHIQHDLFRALPNFFLLTLPQGGHAGFRQSLQGISWAENAAIDFVLSMLTFHVHRDSDGLRAHAYAQTDDECFEYQCRTEEDELVDCEEAQDNDYVFDARCELTDDRPDGQCETTLTDDPVTSEGHCLTSSAYGQYANGHCNSVGVADVEMEKQLRTPTEAHG